MIWYRLVKALYSAFLIVSVSEGLGACGMELGVDDSGVVLENDSDGMVGGGEKMRNAECGIVMNVQCAMCNVQCAIE